MGKPNILLIVCDTLRVDHLGCYGYFRETSPNIDLIAKEGIVFEDFYNSGAPTGPAFTSIYTGLYPIHHKYYHFIAPNTREIDDQIFTMPEILRTCGYTTVAFDSLINFASHTKHWVRGYDFYVNVGENFKIAWIKNYSDEKFFLFIHYWDPHTKFEQPQKYKEIFHHKKGDYSDLEIKTSPTGYQYVPGWGKKGEIIEEEKKEFGSNVSIDLYDGSILYMDQAISEVISTLKEEEVFEDTLVIVTSDHGENLFQHYNFWGHNSLHDTVIHVPLIMRYPKKLPKNVRVNGFCQHIDLLPTILDLLEVNLDVLEFDGESILPLVNGNKIRDTMFMEHANGQRAIRTDEWKFMTEEWARKLCRPPELYNVKSDPMETENLANTHTDKVEEMKELLRNWIENNSKGGIDPAIYQEKEQFTAKRFDSKGISYQLDSENLRLIKYRNKLSQFLKFFDIEPPS
jgi:arylsulfatase A-like enzyme